MEKNELVRYFEGFASGRKEHDKKLLIDELENALCMLSSDEFEYVLGFLKDKDFLTAHECEKLKKEKTVSNKNLILYGLDSRLFAEIWAIGHLQGIDSRFTQSNKEAELRYMGRYEVLLDEIKVGVKACRAMDIKVEGGRFKMALQYTLKKPFVFRFRYLNIQACDVFVLIGVWSDRIIYWVLSQKELHEKASSVVSQGAKKAEVILEINNANISMFNKYRVDVSMLVETIKSKANDTGI